ncbi:MAG: hypothetical protein KF914_18685 [Rhizobiaceae bacterium]|nr:hypothetical protein [Rhizobiaceae bacterium]
MVLRLTLHGRFALASCWAISTLIVCVLNVSYVYARGNDVSVLEQMALNILWMFVPVMVSFLAPDFVYNSRSKVLADASSSVTMAFFSFSIAYLMAFICIVIVVFYFYMSYRFCHSENIFCTTMENIINSGSFEFKSSLRASLGVSLIHLFIFPTVCFFVGYYYFHSFQSAPIGIIFYAIAYASITGLCTFIFYNARIDGFGLGAPLVVALNGAAVALCAVLMGTAGYGVRYLFSNSVERRAMRYIMRTKYNAVDSKAAVEDLVSIILNINPKKDRVSFRIYPSAGNAPVESETKDG